jgi:Autographiviridae endonuclease VII
MTALEVSSPPTEKRCGKCKKVWPIEMYTTNKKSRDGRDWTCRVCHRIMTRIHRLGLHPDVAGTPMPDDGRCEVCGTQPPNWGLCLDHNHTTGAFRGWLCNSCNSALAFAADSADRLRALAAYLDGRG